MVSKVVKSSEKPPNAGKGRVKGVPNKLTGDMREMIRGALDDAGGREFLAEQARENPVAFLNLVGKIIPREIEAKVTGAIELVLADRLKAARERLRSAS
ncbi:hypothetical protein UFOVP66_8 [uncultured Caudovirales phage]|uniref:Uncharacterized protein n=1 Tax=uncultured Caudovirales phage TaxID=2100421 RepID=A0A6J5KQ53_9CAUD|nr:hypothetical protein UFOVP66_8 [uncultured Caudovirales phage]